MGNKLILSYLQIAQLITPFPKKSKIFYLSFEAQDLKVNFAKRNYEAKFVVLILENN